MEDTDMVKLIEEVLAQFAESQINLASESARHDIAMAIAEVLEAPEPSEPTFYKRRDAI
jgi:hypothetical protein